jgi:hypothetical protein
MKPVSDQGGMSYLHRQAGANLMHPRRNTGPEIAITARGACTGRCLLLSSLRTQVRHRGMSEKCHKATSRTLSDRKKLLTEVILKGLKIDARSSFSPISC